jgi:hypothetical protein
MRQFDKSQMNGWIPKFEPTNMICLVIWIYPNRSWKLKISSSSSTSRVRPHLVVDEFSHELQQRRCHLQQTLLEVTSPQKSNLQSVWKNNMDWLVLRNRITLW